MREYAPPGTRLLLASSFLSTVPMGYLLVVLPLYLDRAGIQPAFIGFLYTVSGLLTSVIVAFSGVFADRFGRRRFLVAGTLMPVPSYLVFAATTDAAWLVAASVLGGVGLANGAAGALTISSFDALLAEKASESQRTRVFAASQALWSLALAGGSIAAAVPTLLRTTYGVGDLESYRLPYLAMAAITVVAAALLVPLREDVSVRAARVASGWLPRRSKRAIRFGLRRVGVHERPRSAGVGRDARRGHLRASLGGRFAHVLPRRARLRDRLQPAARATHASGLLRGR